MVAFWHLQHPLSVSSSICFMKEVPFIELPVLGAELGSYASMLCKYPIEEENKKPRAIPVPGLLVSGPSLLVLLC